MFNQSFKRGGKRKWGRSNLKASAENVPELMADAKP